MIYEAAFGTGGKITACAHGDGINGHRFELITGLNPLNFLLSCRQIHAEAVEILYRNNLYRVQFTRRLNKALVLKPSSFFAAFKPSIYHVYVKKEARIELSDRLSYEPSVGRTFWRALSDATKLIPSIVPSAKKVILDYNFNQSNDLLWLLGSASVFGSGNRGIVSNTILTQYQKSWMNQFPLYFGDCPDVELWVSRANRCGRLDDSRAYSWPGSWLRALELAFDKLKAQARESSMVKLLGSRAPSLGASSSSAKTMSTLPRPEIMADNGRRDAVEIFYTILQHNRRGEGPDFHWRVVSSEIHKQLKRLQRADVAVETWFKSLPASQDDHDQGSATFQGCGGFSYSDVYMLEAVPWLHGLKTQELVSALSNQIGAARMREDLGNVEYDETIRYLEGMGTTHT